MWTETHSEEATQAYFPSEKGYTLKGKNLLPRGANSFLLEYIPFQKVTGVQKRAKKKKKKKKKKEQKS